MNQNEAFLQSIIEAPDDDAPRLVYADWLEERGESERAEFIRVQCALDKMPADAPKRPVLQRREEELLARYAWTWAEAFGTQIQEWAFCRGFIERAEMSLETSAEAILAVLRKSPIRYLRDTGQVCELTGLVDALPHLQRLTGLEFWGLYALDDQLVAQLLASPHLGNLRTLILHHDRNGNMVDEEVLCKGLASPHWVNLQTLAVNVDDMWRGPSNRVVRVIAGSPYLRNLRRLDLSNAGDVGHRPEMNLETIRCLVESPNLTQLEELDLSSCMFSREVWDAILQAPWLPHLKWLRLRWALLVDPEGNHSADLEEVPEYRDAFNQRVAKVDWNADNTGAWGGRPCWNGYSWAGLRQQHLFSMWPYVQRKDYDGLEAAFRESCRQHAGDEAATAIDALPFGRYEERLRPGLKRAIAAAGRRPNATAIYLRIRPDLRWEGEYHVSDETPPTPFKPYQSYSHTALLAQYKAPSFPQAAVVRDRFPARGPLDPGGALHYLLARTVAAFGRCVRRYESPVPVCFSCMWAVFRM